MKLKTIYSIAFIVIIIASLGVFATYKYNDSHSLVISTTTSVYGTGLLDLLTTQFKEETGIDVSVIPVGSGAAIDLGRKGEVDALLVHAPALEQELVGDNIALNHTTLWYNYFIIAGPANDPANISMASSAEEAFARIATTKSPFYSRGDNSGTHIKELSIWGNSTPDAATDDWYIETGAGMSATLTTANENSGYVLTDHGTYTKLHASDDLPNLDIQYTGDTSLYNPYSYMVINPELYSGLHYENAIKFLRFLTSETANSIVNNLVIGEVQLFTPVDK